MSKQERREMIDWRRTRPGRLPLRPARLLAIGQKSRHETLNSKHVNVSVRFHKQRSSKLFLLPGLEARVHLPMITCCQIRSEK